MVRFLPVILAAFPMAAFAGQLRGLVLDGVTKEPLARAQIRVEAKTVAAVTDAAGRFLIDDLAPGTYSLKTIIIGYLPLTEPVIVKDSGTEVELMMVPDTLRRKESLDVSAGPYGNDSAFSLSMQGTELRNLSTVMIDDPLRAVQALPGVTANDDFQAQFSMRGAGFDRIGVYIDGLLLHSPFHTVQGDQSSASLSAVQGEMLEAATLHSGAPPVKFGDRTVGALELYTRESDAKRVRLRGTVSMSNVAFTAEGPILDKGSWVTSFRKSYLQYIINLTSTDPSLVFAFWDVQTKLVYRPKPKHQVSFFALDGHSGLDRSDAIARLGVSSLIWSNFHTSILHAGWRYTPQEKLTISTHAAYMQERYDTLNKTRIPMGYGHYGEWVSNSDLSKSWNGGAIFEAGFSARRITSSGYSQQLFNAPAQPFLLDSYRGSGVRTGGYAQQSLRLHKHVDLKLGTRVDHQDVAGSAVASPYATLGIQLLEKTRLSLAWSHSVQYPDATQYASIFGRRNLLPERAIHYEATLDQMLDSRTRLRVEAYSRQDRDLLFRSLLEPRFSNGRYIDFNRRAPWENSIRGYARGYLVTLQRRAANHLTGWISYGYGSARSSDGIAHTAFAADYDQRHTVQIFGSYRFTPTINFSSKWVYGSGMPVQGYYEPRGADNYLSAKRNQLRMQPYERLDMRLNKSFVLKRFQATLFAEVINVKNYGNKRFDQIRSFDARTGKANLAFDQTIPILPSAGVVFDF